MHPAEAEWPVRPSRMNFFCRIYGHTWVHEADTPKVAWNNDKSLSELFPKSEGEPTFFRRCVRCQERRPWDSK
jgi:hypothetical protein